MNRNTHLQVLPDLFSCINRCLERNRQRQAGSVAKRQPVLLSRRDQAPSRLRVFLDIRCSRDYDRKSLRPCLIQRKAAFYQLGLNLSEIYSAGNGAIQDFIRQSIRASFALQKGKNRRSIQNDFIHASRPHAAPHSIRPQARLPVGSLGTLAPARVATFPAWLQCATHCPQQPDQALRRQPSPTPPASPQGLRAALLPQCAFEPEGSQ